MLQSLAAFLAVSAVVICTPGQDTALTIRNTFGGGRPSGIATAGGVALGQAVWTIAASLGVVALLSASEPVFHALKLAGTAYLIYLGMQSLSAAMHRTDPSHEVRRVTPLAPSRALRQGVVSNIGTLYAVARVQPLLAGPTRQALDALTGIVLVAFGVRLALDER